MIREKPAKGQKMHLAEFKACCAAGFCEPKPRVSHSRNLPGVTSFVGAMTRYIRAVTAQRQLNCKASVMDRDGGDVTVIIGFSCVQKTWSMNADATDRRMNRCFLSFRNRSMPFAHSRLRAFRRNRMEMI